MEKIRLDPTRREFMVLPAGAALAGGLRPAAPWPLYAFDNGLGGIGSPEEKVRLLKDLGYDGIEYHVNPAEMPRMLEALEKHGLRMHGIYTTPFIEDPLPAGWGDWIRLLKGRETRIETGLRSKSRKPSDPAGDDAGEALLKAVSDLCADTGPVVSVYPHAGFWTERTDDGVRLAKRLGRKNVGTNFNLVHWQWVKQARTLEETLADARPHLLLVTLNGLKGPADKRQQIRPLDDSDYDLAGFLGLVKKSGYRGPTGLQCWSVKEPPAEHLKRSMEAWKKLTADL